MFLQHCDRHPVPPPAWLARAASALAHAASSAAQPHERAHLPPLLPPQMVSLLHLADITEEGVTFQSPTDGKRMLLTPEHSIQVAGVAVRRRQLAVGLLSWSSGDRGRHMHAHACTCMLWRHSSGFPLGGLASRWMLGGQQPVHQLPGWAWWALHAAACPPAPLELPTWMPARRCRTGIALTLFIACLLLLNCLPGCPPAGAEPAGC